MTTRMRLLVCLALVGLFAGCDPAALDPVKKPEGEKSSKSTADKPPTHKVEKGPFKVEASCKGVFEPTEATEVSLNPEVWNPQTGGGNLLVLKSVEHGTHVRKGDVLVTLDLEKIDQAIRDLENEQTLAELSLKQAEEELPVLERLTPVELAAAARAKKLADEDLRRFVDRERAFDEKSAQFRVKSAKEYLEYELEELKQLEKMYKAKDLTEDTEEIILKRQRNSVEMSRYFVEMSEHYRDNTLQIELPRREYSAKEHALQAGLALEKARATLPLQLRQKHLALRKQRYDHDKATDKLAKLRRDREILTVKAPADGIAYYGKSEHGKWDTSSVTSKLRAGGMLMPHEVFMTVVKARPLVVRAEVEEKDLPLVRPGGKGKVVPTADADLRIPCWVEKVSDVPVAPGHFEARVVLESGKVPESLTPGMACTVKFVPYAKPDAITVPSKAVFSEELDEDQHYVYLAGKGKPEKHAVEVGKKSGDKVEIVKGLKPGDEILLEKPDAHKKGGE